MQSKRVFILYSSFTGNTKKIAKQIKNGLESCNNNLNIDIAKLGQTVQNRKFSELSKYDLVGLGSPVHYYHESFDFRAYLQSITGLEGKPVFYFCTRCTQIGDTINSVRAQLENKGGTFLGSFSCFGEVTLPFYPTPYYTYGHPSEKELQQATNFASEIYQRFQRFLRGEFQSLPWEETDSRIKEIAETHNLEYVKKNYPKFSFDSKLCKGCNLCENICPVEGIDLKSKPIRLQDPCLYCLSCVSLCPTQAIHADWGDSYESVKEHSKMVLQQLQSLKEKGKYEFYLDPKEVKFHQSKSE